MSRRRKIQKREVLPDPKYKSILVTKFISNLMRKGKKSIAESILYNALDYIEERTGQNSLEVFQKAVEKEIEIGNTVLKEKSLSEFAVEWQAELDNNMDLFTEEELDNNVPCMCAL